MKKKILLILSLFLALFCACSNDDDDNSDTTTSYKYQLSIYNNAYNGDIYVTLENTDINCINKFVKDSSYINLELTEAQLEKAKETTFKVIVYQPEISKRDTLYYTPGVEQCNSNFIYFNIAYLN